MSQTERYSRTMSPRLERAKSNSDGSRRKKPTGFEGFARELRKGFASHVRAALLHFPPCSRLGTYRYRLQCERFSKNIRREDCVVKLRLRDNEGINDAVKRFRKLVEHAGIKKEMRRREFYEKPSETRRRARRRAERRSRIQRMVGGGSSPASAPASKPDR